MSISRRGTVFTAAAVAAALVAVAMLWVNRGPGVATVEGSDRFPHATLTDVVSYADFLVVASVTAEHAIEEDPDPNINGGYFGRSVDLAIERTLWTRPGASTKVPDKLNLIDLGWMADGDRRVPVVLEGAQRLEVGTRYVLPLLVDGEDKWTPLTTKLAIPVDDGRTASISGEAAARALSSQPVDTLGALLERTPPDPVAARFADLPADERFGAVSQELAKSEVDP